MHRSAASLLALAAARSRAIAPATYALRGVDLAARWRALVRDGAVSAATDEATYGVRCYVDGDYRFFVEGASERAKALNATLSRGDGFVIWRDGPFEAQLQLSRALRPAPMFGGEGTAPCVPPPYERGSLVEGPLRLELRPKAAAVAVNDRRWSSPSV